MERSRHTNGIDMTGRGEKTGARPPCSGQPVAESDRSSPPPAPDLRAEAPGLGEAARRAQQRPARFGLLGVSASGSADRRAADASEAWGPIPEVFPGLRWPVVGVTVGEAWVISFVHKRYMVSHACVGSRR